MGIDGNEVRFQCIDFISIEVVLYGLIASDRLNSELVIHLDSQLTEVFEVVLNSIEVHGVESVPGVNTIDILTVPIGFRCRPRHFNLQSFGRLLDPKMLA